MKCVVHTNSWVHWIHEVKNTGSESFLEKVVKSLYNRTKSSNLRMRIKTDGRT